THQKGRVSKTPRGFTLGDAAQALQVEQADDSFEVTLGRLKVTLQKKPHQLHFTDAVTGEPITSSPFKGQGLMEKQGVGPFMREQLTLSVGEVVYGLGERFSAFTRNGQSVDMWNADCGTCSDKGYKDVPFFLTSRG